jgi:hypothetical protein
MANHKRKRPKHQRAGCLMCKPHKDERGKNSQSNYVVKRSVRRKLQGNWKDEY